MKPEGIDLTFLPLMMPEPAFRMLRHGEFDVAEMSLSWYTRTVFAETRPFIAIPVFPSRMFRHSCVYVNAKSGIERAATISSGKPVGCPEYQMTAAVWLKGILADHHGVPVDSVQYHTGGLEEPGRTETPMNLPSRSRSRLSSMTRRFSDAGGWRDRRALHRAPAVDVSPTGPAKCGGFGPTPGAVEREYYPTPASSRSCT